MLWSLRDGLRFQVISFVNSSPFPQRMTHPPYFSVQRLAFARVLDGTTFTASNHRNSILATPDRYHLHVINLIWSIGDYCSTNGATADLSGIALLVRRSRRLKLAIKTCIEHCIGTEVSLVTTLMFKLSTLKGAGQTSLTTSFWLIKRNKTRCPGVIKILVC